MGCGSSSTQVGIDAHPIVPAINGVSSTRGTASMKISIQGANSGKGSIKGANGLTVTPAAATVSSSDNMLVSRRGMPLLPVVTDQEIQAMKASNSLNWCDPNVFTGRMQEAFDYYAKPGTEEIHRSGLERMAKDCVDSFLMALTKDFKKQHPTWPDAKIESKVNLTRPQFLPGVTVENSIEIARYHLAHELKMTASNPIITRACFFLHFPRVHKNLFSYTALTIEREQLVLKLNQKSVNILSQQDKTGTKSIRSVKSISNANHEINKDKDGNSNINNHKIKSVASMRTTSNTSAHKKKKSSNKSIPAARSNMFDLDEGAEDKGGSEGVLSGKSSGKSSGKGSKKGKKKKRTASRGGVSMSQTSNASTTDPESSSDTERAGVNKKNNSLQLPPLGDAPAVKEESEEDSS